VVVSSISGGDRSARRKSNYNIITTTTMTVTTTTMTASVTQIDIFLVCFLYLKNINLCNRGRHGRGRNDIVVGFSTGTAVTSTNRTDHHNITGVFQFFSILAVYMATAAILKKSTLKGTTSHGI
jgi:hypothetical protein